MDAADPPDPGPIPTRGIVVRAEGEGFYARVYPKPHLGVTWPIAIVVGLGVVGWGASLVLGDAPALRVQVVGATVVFGLVIAGVAYGYGFVPVEVSADDETLYWGGERWPIAEVGSCRPEGRRLVLRARDGTEIGAIANLVPEVAVWVGRAVELSVPRVSRSHTHESSETDP